MEFIEKHHILKDYQFGFRKGHNTSHGISHLNEVKPRQGLCSPAEIEKEQKLKHPGRVP